MPLHSQPFIIQPSSFRILIHPAALAYSSSVFNSRPIKT